MMPIIQAYKCSKTKKLFEHKSDYINHLKDLAYLQIRDKKHKRIRKEYVEKPVEDLSNLSSVEEIVEYIVENMETFIIRGYILNSGRNTVLGSRSFIDYFADPNYEITNLPKLVEFEIDGVWSETVSNSHHKPKNGVYNWSRESGKPIGYPGITGNIRYSFDKDNFEIIDKRKKTKKSKIITQTPCFEFVRYTGIQTGTGTGGQTVQAYVCIFGDDFPYLKTLLLLNMDKGKTQKIRVTWSEDYGLKSFQD